MRITQYINYELGDDEQRIVEYLWYQEYDNFLEQYNDDMTFDEFQEHLFGHILGSVVNILMKTEKNINLVKDMYFAMTGKDAEEEVVEEEEEKEEIQPHCYVCYNMNMNMNVTCFRCAKIYCKSHSYCLLGYDADMPYCSKECFLDC